MMFATVPAVAGLVQAGKLRALAGAAPERLPQIPATPTLGESGLPGAGMRDWHGLVAPAGTPPQRIEQVARALDKVVGTESVRQSMRAAGLEPVLSSSPEAFRTFVAQEAARWGELVRVAGISLQ